MLLDLAGLDREPIRSSESGQKPLERKCLPCISADVRAAGSDSVFKHKTASSQLLTEFWLEKHYLPYFLFTFSNETNISVSLFVCFLHFLCLSLQLTDHISFMMHLTFKKMYFNSRFLVFFFLNLFSCDLSSVAHNQTLQRKWTTTVFPGNLKMLPRSAIAIILGAHPVVCLTDLHHLF